VTQPQYPGVQIITKPGGLSGAAHAVHILICVFTCGLWIPGYIAFIAFAPAQRYEVLAPYGTDPQVIAAARASVERQYPPPKPEPEHPNFWQRMPPLLRAAIIVGGGMGLVYAILYGVSLALHVKWW